MENIQQEIQKRYELQEEYLGKQKFVNKVTPLVSIQVQTYQHSRYIKQCLDGILAQKTQFPFEVIIGEDHSSDGTRDICIEYAEKYPDIIRLFLRDRKISHLCDENGNFIKRLNGVFCRMSARGKYLAICEGDDYWTDPYKLQKQVEFLEANPDYMICFHNAEVKDETGEYNNIALYSDFPWNNIDRKRDTYTIEDLIAAPLCPSASVIFRKPSKYTLPNWYNKVPSGDMAFQILICGDKKIKYFDENWAVYRKHSGGISVQHQGDYIHSGRIYMYLRVKEHYKGKYAETINKVVKWHLQQLETIDQISDDDKVILYSMFPEYLCALEKNHYFTIHLLTDRGKYIEAFDFLEDFIGKNPEYIHIRNDIAALIFMKGILDKSEISIEPQSDCDNDILTYQLNIAKSLIASNLHDQAVMILNYLKEKYPDDLQVLMLLAETCNNRNDYEVAEDCYKKVLELESDNQTAREGLNKLKINEIYREEIQPLLEEGKFTDAIPLLEKFTGENENYAPSLNDLGVAYYTVGDIESALIFIEKAISLSPDNIQYLRNLLSLRVEQNIINEAVDTYHKIIEISPQDLESRQLIADMFYIRNMYDHAMSVWIEMLKVDPINSYSINKLKEVYRDAYVSGTIKIEMLKNLCNALNENIKRYGHEHDNIASHSFMSALTKIKENKYDDAIDYLLEGMSVDYKNMIANTLFMHLLIIKSVSNNEESYA